MEEHQQRLRVLKNRVLRNTLASKRRSNAVATFFTVFKFTLKPVS
jgi:hypothetical protein